MTIFSIAGFTKWIYGSISPPPCIRTTHTNLLMACWSSCTILPIFSNAAAGPDYIL